MHHPDVIAFADPEFPYPLGDPRGSVARFRCPAPEGCTWWHEELADPGQGGPLRITLGTAEEIGVEVGTPPEAWGPEVWARARTAIQEHADGRLREFWRRVTTACAGHVTDAHPDAAWSVPQGAGPEPRPVPTFPYPQGHPLEKMARFACPRGCGWYQDHSRDLGAPRMEVATPEAIGEVQARLQAQTTALVDAFWGRVWAGIAEHLDLVHPEAGP